MVVQSDSVKKGTDYSNRVANTAAAVLCTKIGNYTGSTTIMASAMDDEDVIDVNEV